MVDDNVVDVGDVVDDDVVDDDVVEVSGEVVVVDEVELVVEVVLVSGAVVEVDEVELVVEVELVEEVEVVDVVDVGVATAAVPPTMEITKVRSPSRITTRRIADPPLKPAPLLAIANLDSAVDCVAGS